MQSTTTAKTVDAWDHTRARYIKYMCQRISLLFFQFKIDCKTVGFFLKISKEIGKAWRKSLTFDCSRVLEYAKIRTVLQSTFTIFLYRKGMTLCST